MSELPTDLSVFVVLWVSLRFAGTVFRISVVLLISLIPLVRGFTESRPGKAKEGQKHKLTTQKSHCVKYLRSLLA